jgi:hypothetical protein
MTHEPETQIELDILAFVNGQLDGELRFAVMEYLSQNPDRAAEVMADLQLTEGLRLAMSAVATPPPEKMRQTADRLATSMAQQTAWRRWVTLAAAVALFSLGWGAQGVLQGSSQKSDLAAILDTALDVRDAVSLRASLSRDIGPMPKDSERIAARLGIVLPEMPPGWTIRAAQVVATPDRPGLAVLIDSPDLGEVLLFGVLRSVDGPDGPATVTSRDGHTLAFFERDRTAFVLVDASGSPAEVQQGAEVLRHRFN